jgi:uncharacterized protein (TIGR02145 family)
MLKHFLAFGTLTLSLNVTSVDYINQFNKEAYLNLNQEYNFNNQEFVKKESVLDDIFTEALYSVRNELGSTDSDNVNQLGSRISDNIKNKIVNSSISKTEQFINKTANELINDEIDNGKTIISVNITGEGTPTYSVETIQSLAELKKDSSHLTFIQAKFESGEDYREDPNNLNIGIGQRYLLDGSRTILGINLFNDYQTVTGHQRTSLGFEFQRANFTANFNKYFAVSDKLAIDDGYVEEVLSGLDIRLTGQMPFLPWAKIKASHYIWDKTDTEGSEDVTGTILGVEVHLNPAISFEIGFEDSSVAESEAYAQLSAHLPLRSIDTLTNFKYSNKAFANSNIISLSDLNLVERSSKIRIETILDGDNMTGGVYSATTVGATCTLYNSSGVAINRGVGQTTDTGSFHLSKVVVPKGLISMKCEGGSYADEATGQVVNPAPTLHAATTYSGLEDLVLIASPLSEIAYQLADDIGLVNYIDIKNTQIATAFGIKGVDITATTPTDINIEVAKDNDSGKFGLALVAISQMSENLGNTVSAGSASIIETLYADMADGKIDGVDGVDVITAINNFKNSTGNNNNTDGTGASNVGSAESAIGEDSMMGGLSITKIDSYNGDNSAPTLEDYISAGVTGVTAENLFSVNSSMIGYNVSTTAKIQDRVNIGTEITSTSLAKISNYDNDSSLENTPTVQDYENIDVTGVTEDNLDYMNDKIASKATTEKDTSAKIQSVIDNVVTTHFSIDAIDDISTPENTIFTGPIPSLTGDVIGSVTYVMSGVDENAFTINHVTGVVSMIHRNFESPDDFNTDNVYEITITATDADGNSDDENIIVTITNEPESANFTINAIDNVTISENESFTGVTPVLSGDTPYGTVTYSLEGVDAHLFTIDATTGVVFTIGHDFDQPTDADKNNVYEIIITATDSDNNTDSEEQFITITDVYDAILSIDPIDDAAIPENTDFTGVTPVLSSNYIQTDTIVYTLGGVDASVFTIDATTGVVSMDSRNFEDPQDENKDNVYEIIIIVTDANETYSEEQTISIANVVESANFTIDNIADTVVASGTAFTGETPIIGGETPIGTLVYSLGGVDSAVASIDNLTGVVSMTAKDFSNPEDANKDNVYEITITATDSEGNAVIKEQIITIVAVTGVTLGTQVWSESNIKLVPSEFNNQGTDYWQGSYDGTVSDGYYYTWNAAINACSAGWHLPSDDDWKTLEGFLGMTTEEQNAFGWRGAAGTQLKENGTTGFNAKFRGIYTTEGDFEFSNDVAYYWTNTKTISGDSDAYRRNLSDSESGIYRDSVNKSYGFNVRCIMDI